MTEKYQKQGGWYNRIVNAFSLLLVLSLAFVFIYIATNGKINIDLLKELLSPAPLEVQTNPQMNHPPSDLQAEPQTDLSSEQQISSQTNTSTELQVDKPKTDASATLQADPLIDKPKTDLQVDSETDTPKVDSQVDTRRDKPKTDSEEKRPSETDTLFVPDVTPTLVNGIKKAQSLTDLLILGAVGQYGVTNSYNGSYQKLSYPNGDVDISTGVCTDVVIRAFRSIKIDLQKEIHQDMSRHFRKYPRK